MVLIGSAKRIEQSPEACKSAHLVLEAVDYDTYIIRKNLANHDGVNPVGRELNQFRAFKLAAATVEHVRRADALLASEEETT